VGYQLYREILDYAPAAWSSGERLVALVIADDAGELTRRSWIANTLLCQRAGLSQTGVRSALQKLAGRGYEMRVSHGEDALGRPVYAVTGHAVDYLVPPVSALLGDTGASPSSVDNRAGRRHENVAYLADKATVLHHQGDSPASQGDGGVSPLSSGLLITPQITNGPELDGSLESSGLSTGQDHDFGRELGGPRHMTQLEREALSALEQTHHAQHAEEA
jgi:hypothetical protein